MTMEYPTPLLNALADGAVIDVRLRFAMRLLEAPGFMRHFETWDTEQRAAAAGAALDIAEALYAQAHTRGWIKPLPTDNNLPNAERAAVERSGIAQAAAQISGQRFAQDEMSKQIQVPQRVMNG